MLPPPRPPKKHRGIISFFIRERDTTPSYKKCNVNLSDSKTESYDHVDIQVQADEEYDRQQ